MRTWHNPATAWRRWLFLTFPALAALALTLALAIPASAAATVIDINVHVPFGGPVFNPCTGGDITLSGDDHIMAHEIINDADHAEIHVHSNVHLTGTDDQGNAYIGNLEGESVLNVRVGEEATDTQSLLEISKGAAPNFTAHFTLHITANANGTITAEVDHATATCQG